jgi:pimeloyl-ACP methyl ester carboxylesterase
MYYEIHGSGKPLVLLHGGFMTIEAMGALVPDLAKTRQVVAVELQGHGHTADIDRPFTFEQLADDTLALMRQVGVESADVAGFSLGGGVSLQMAIRHPNAVRRLVVISAPCKSDGWYPEVRAAMAAITPEPLIGSPIHKAYVETASKPDDWPKLVTTTKQLVGGAYDWSAPVAGIKSPMLIVIGDADAVRPAHALEMFGQLGGGKGDGMTGGSPNSQLAVFQGTTHLTILSRTDLLIPIITSFPDAPVSAARE